MNEEEDEKKIPENEISSNDDPGEALQSDEELIRNDEEQSAPELIGEKKVLYEELLRNMDNLENAEDNNNDNNSDNNSDNNENSGFDDNDTIDDNNDERKSGKRRKSSVKHLIFSLIVTALIVSAAFLCAGFAINIGREIMGIGKADTKIVIEIPETDSISRVADIFEADGIITNRDLFLFFARVRGLKTIVPGVHEFAPNMTYGELADELQSAATTDEREAVDITFPEGITLTEAGNILERADICSKTEFIQLFNTSSFGFDFEANVRSSPLKFYKMEGYCFPDTYRLYSDEDVKSIVKKIYRNFNTKFTPDIAQRMSDMGLTQDELITFASIVQNEAGRVSDMKRVASVFWNRLNNPDEYPLLQSDPTSNYVKDVIMTNNDIASEEMYDAYNTYIGAGLPPGPISNPGLDAINAVLYPAETDYYYFCSNLETGEFYYAANLREHEENLVTAGLVN
jgi:UPF0755 protein